MLKFIQITDPHLVPKGQTLYGRNPEIGLKAAIADINRHHSDAAFVVITGDLTHRGEPEAYELLRDNLADLRIPCHLIVGNHDHRNHFLEVFPQTPRDDNGFIQFSIGTGVGAFIFLDTLQESEASGYICPKRMRWLAAALEANSEQPVYLFMHHPPFDIGIDGMDRIGLENKAGFAQCIRTHGDVRQIFFGHVHRPIHGTWQGIGFSTQRGTNHQVDLDFTPGKPNIGTFESPAYSVVLAAADRIIVHLRDYSDTSPRFELRSKRAQRATDLDDLRRIVGIDSMI